MHIFLCYFHQHDITSCRWALSKLSHTVYQNIKNMTDVRELQSFILLGIALQMTDDKKYAKLWFFVAASIDK